MGRVLLVGRLAVRNVRRHPVEAVLLVLAIMAATTTLTVGRVLDGVTNSPYERTRESTAGPDVVASVGPEYLAPGRIVPVDPSGLDGLAEADGVVAHSGPFPATTATLAVDDLSADTWVQGRGATPSPVDQPRLTEGRWLEDEADGGAVVVEAAFADALGVGPGDRITLDEQEFRVVGVAVTAVASYTDVCFGAECGFFFGREPDDLQRGGREPEGPTIAVDLAPPPDDAGLVWLTNADTRRLAPDDTALSYVLNLELDDPAQADAFVEAHTATGGGAAFLASWQDLRSTYDEFVREAQEALGAFGALLTLLAIASVAVLVGGRIADQTRRVGELKAVGGTPGLVAAVLLTEYVVLALLAAAAGIALGWQVAPLLSDPGAGLLGSAGTPSLTVPTIAVVTAVALGVAVVASAVSAVRAARTSTVRALADTARQPRRARLLIALSARLPIPLLLGVRVIARRPRRVVLGVASIAVTVSGIVALLAGRAAMSADWDGATRLDPQADRANQVLAVVAAMLIALAAINAVVITWAAALDARHALALARALGATPRQVSAGLSAAQVLPALVGALLGAAGGLALWATIGDEHDPTYGLLLAVVAGTVLVVAGLTAIPARLGARRPAAVVLQAERA